MFLIGTFNAITSSWESSRDSSGTQQILLNPICGLIVKPRGVFSDFSYPEYIVEVLLELVGNMAESGGCDTTQWHIIDALEELWNVESWEGAWAAVNRRFKFAQYTGSPVCRLLSE